MKKILIYLMMISIIFMTAFCKIDSHAAEEGTATDGTPQTATATDAEKYDETKGVVTIRLMFCTDTGARDIIKTGTAFFVGSDTDKYLISTCDTVLLTDTEKEEVAYSHGVELDKVKTAIELVLRDDIIIDLSIVNSSEVLNLSILQPTDDLGSFTTIRLCESSNVFNKGSVLHSYNQDMTRVDCKIEDWAEIEDSHYFKYSSDVEIPVGFPLLNDEGEVVAIASAKNKGNAEEKYALQVDEVIDIFNKLGIAYNQQIVVDYSALEAIIKEFETLEEKDYTLESWKKAQKSYEKALIELEKVSEGTPNKYTQDEINESVNNLRTDIDGLEKKGISVKQVVIISIIIDVILLSVIIALIVINIRNQKSYEKKLKEEGDRAGIAREALKAGDRITPGTIPNTTNRGIAATPSQMIPNNTNYETTVLFDESAVSSSGGFENIVTYPTLIRMKTGERVKVDQNSFVIGSVLDSVDYCVSGNTNISRKHACIMRFEDGFYIQDLETTNGTFVNNMRVMPGSYVKLASGNLIRLAEEEFEFKE